MINLAIIPARGGSKGLRNKNILPLAGKPLISYTIECAQQSTLVDHTLVSTDSLEIAEVSRKSGAEVPFIRPAELSSDTASSIDVLIHAVKKFEEETGKRVANVILLQPTSPLRTTAQLNQAIELYLANEQTPVVSVCESESHPYYLRKISGNNLVPYDDTANNHLRRQDLETVYQLNGAIYITSRDFLIEHGLIYKDRVIPYVMHKEASIDIDDKYDFLTAEAILKEMNTGDERFV
ncbi:acylneuraminate cytidylyltransferase family protein [Rossellomorea sp. NS-SX7]|uniref:acylneuraminate cytidylyltransferase family protein n=1 Tax=Rossellomorea sp. NS-SX7 TaxID=3463856 RepID=UPI0040599F3E